MFTITQEYLISNPTHIFVFGDNLLHKGKGGAAELRYLTNTHGFITKKYPNNKDSSFYKPVEYKLIFQKELSILKRSIENVNYKNFKWLITPLGSGLANRYYIWEKTIKPGLEVLRKYPNVVFLWEVDKL